uniref:hypothetical protein n=1 Tax=Fusobacterium mortiferum TaxID=850 RepID=UPI003FEF5357
RTNGENSTSDYALAAWSQKAKIEARKIETDSINIKKLERGTKITFYISKEDKC